MPIYYEYKPTWLHGKAAGCKKRAPLHGKNKENERSVEGVPPGGREGPWSLLSPRPFESWDTNM